MQKKTLNHTWVKLKSVLKMCLPAPTEDYAERKQHQYNIVSNLILNHVYISVNQ